MKLLLTALLLTVCVSVPASSARQEAGQVSVQLSAVDREGRPVEGLKPEDLRVTVEDAEQKVLSLSSRTEEPLHVVIMLDASASQERVLPKVRPAAADFVSSLLRGGSNDAAVVSFTFETKVVQGLTGDGEALRRAVASVSFVRPPGYFDGTIVTTRPQKNDPIVRAGLTAIWDSLFAVCEEVFARAKAGRRVVVLVTDGVDTGSRLKHDKVFERLLREGVVVYNVGLAEEYTFDPVDKSTLRKLSERTGGRAFFPRKRKDGDLPVAFEQVRGELLNTYALTFDAPAKLRTGKPLKLRVEVVNPELRRQGVQLAHPQSLLMEPGR